jgi:heme exporter protein A
MPTLEVRNLAAQRGSTRLFAGLSFRVDPGQALIVTGSNGTGKTTLLRIVAGFSTAAAGEIRWDGSPVAPFDPALRGAAAFAGHQTALKDELTTEENLESLVALSGEPATPKAIDDALDAVALTRQRKLPARVLSQGQRRRIGLARLRLSHRPLWILDEPVTALDAAGTALLAELVTAHLEQGGLALAATHTMLGLPETRVHPLALS